MISWKRNSYLRKILTSSTRDLSCRKTLSNTTMKVRYSIKITVLIMFNNKNTMMITRLPILMTKKTNLHSTPVTTNRCKKTKLIQINLMINKTISIKTQTPTPTPTQNHSNCSQVASLKPTSSTRNPTRTVNLRNLPARKIKITSTNQINNNSQKTKTRNKPWQIVSLNAPDQVVSCTSTPSNQICSLKTWFNKEIVFHQSTWKRVNTNSIRVPSIKVNG